LVKGRRRGAHATHGDLDDVPGLVVVFPAGAFAGDVGVEAEASSWGEGFYGDDVPGIEGWDVDGEDVDVVGGVGDFAFAVDGVGGLDVVAAGADDFGAFDLHAPEAAMVVEDEVVAIAVSPGLGAVQAEGFGFEQEGGFGELSGALGVAVDGRRSAGWGG